MESFKITDLKLDDNLIIQDHICKIVNISFSKTPKKGIRKFLFIGIDVITGIKYECLHKSNCKITLENSVYNIC